MNPHPLEYEDELRTVGSLPLGENEHQRAALALAANVDLYDPPRILAVQIDLAMPQGNAATLGLLYLGERVGPTRVWGRHGALASLLPQDRGCGLSIRPQSRVAGVNR